ncbi:MULTISPECIES: alpha-D-ribose 1-methylphosphonate 5-triphosphate diphosphatase [Mycobacteriaceae]|jgi:alpha-D-ribose 1-methylphosphonate 5-triphosphate diphosphatase|uniref:Alpha-D-ribose 1-methylphosphonate 5-triphosphate diphosphatase n=1 Tax=Mycolicibacterium rhodesiae TaxID=36814 RepID=A0A1X0IJG2_MYCRH|nr:MULTISPECIES: alpha-D-ribose 1-methylphosphonate 5-triphosphate diphosphatase [Mycobacteriaceae]KRQ18105.1 metal-dependent hydrolase [Mycobacteroides sp. H072]KRQ68182.1 metal-dependent hydrolase [Mycobacteroides sp. H001]MCV7343308.1 alpha-D-ribose 1-methylphosphonate 5-triphosphate diphosphatase [Mycolicibacterium rhodesiae]ORB47046.1 alpha-D-ribose 1-methylphosphonate 5-triphosphate diphosphatase [Mycolicibacterium rhodesiae]WGI36246.1 alpha-D-ribose 1-methylphosphonate 5-triphosphate di
MTAWTPGQPLPDYVIGHVIAVLPERLVDDAHVVVREGKIAEVGPHSPGLRYDLDGRGAALLPGLVDAHSDALGLELRSRPGTEIDATFALASTGSRLRASGVTTVFHGLAFQRRSIVGMPIGSPNASELSAALCERDDDYHVDHRVLHRLDVRCEQGRALLEEQLVAYKARRPAVAPVVSHEDHTPGLGQFADPATMCRWLMIQEGMSETQAASHVTRWRAERERYADVRDETLVWLSTLARAGQIRLFGHDLATGNDIAELADRGGLVAEFPTTMQAAKAARDRDLFVVAGAANVVQGGSHTGNVSAAELVAAGLVHALASDYLPTSMLAAAVHLARQGLLSLPQAVTLVTLGPAVCVGLNDRGALREGMRADLVLADLSPTWPVVHAVLRASPQTAPPPSAS